MRTIRRKEKRREIRTLDRAKIAGERMKKAYLRSRDTLRDLSDDGAVTPDEYAADQTRRGMEEIRTEASRAVGRRPGRSAAGGRIRKGGTAYRLSGAAPRKVSGMRKAYGGIRRAAGEMKRAALSFPVAAIAAALLLAVILTLVILTAGAGYGGWGGDEQIVQVALSQVGNEGGEPYWSWYGFGSHVDWCACFVSWCADRCGCLDSGLLPKFAVCGDGMRWFQERGQWVGGGSEPRPGMIIFFDWDDPDVESARDGLPDHVGIVVRTEGGAVRTVEGNTGDLCAQRRYAVNDPQILGYGWMAGPETPA